MKMFFIILSLVANQARSANFLVVLPEKSNQNSFDELDPFAKNISEILKNYDRIYESATGLSAHEIALDFSRIWNDSSCVQMQCEIYVQVVKSQQKIYLYRHGNLIATWATSTGIPERETPLFDTHPDGRIYTAYTSVKFPGGDFNGLGNMPYAVFIKGGFAIHGTGKPNWPKLGSKASHGCIRIHPDNAKYFNSLVRANGVQNVWVTVQE